MNENEISRVVMDEVFDIHRRLGPGLLESVYEAVLEQRLTCAGLAVQRQVPVPIRFEGVQLNEGFRADLIVNAKAIIELKSVERTLPLHFKKLLTYLRLTGCKLGLPINFGEGLLKDGFKRVANGL